MIPSTLPKGTTRQQWEQYELDCRNHDARIARKREFLDEILNHYTQTLSLVETRKHFIEQIQREQIMDAPNEPGYYRANND